MLSEQEAFEAFLSNRPVIAEYQKKLKVVLIKGIIRPLSYYDYCHELDDLDDCCKGDFGKEDILLVIYPADDKKSGRRLETVSIEDAYPLTKVGFQEAKRHYEDVVRKKVLKELEPIEEALRAHSS